MSRPSTIAPRQTPQSIQGQRSDSVISMAASQRQPQNQRSFASQGVRSVAHQEQRPSVPFPEQRPSLAYQEQRPSLSHQEQRPSLSHQEQRPFVSNQSQRPSILHQEQFPRIQQQIYPPMNYVEPKLKKSRMIPLTAFGHLVIDIPVAKRIRQMGKFDNSDEFTHLRYSAITSSADDFGSSGFSLRQQELKRKTEMFIVVTMYNEDDHLFSKTMTALMKNIAYLCSRTNSKTWGTDGWKGAVVCIVSDGRSKIHPRTLDVLGIMGCYQEGIMKENVNGKDVQAHLFEYTTQVAVSEDLMVKGHESGFVPVQIMFCLKEKNAKKVIDLLKIRLTHIVGSLMHLDHC